MKWKTLSSEYITRFHYFTSRKDKCETSSGKIVEEYYVVEMGLTVVALGITEDNQAVLVKQYRHPLEETLLELPGGFADGNEDPQQALEREFLEETGYAFSKVEYVGEVSANPGVLTNYTKLYLATGGKKVAAQSLDNNEDIEVVLVPLSELKELLLQNKIVQALHVCCIFYALEKLNGKA